jgi:hypothetical protein
MTCEDETLEDALITLCETVFEPERAATLIRKNISNRIACEYTVKFYATEGGIAMETKLHTQAEPKRLGKKVVV